MNFPKTVAMACLLAASAVNGQTLLPDQKCEGIAAGGPVLIKGRSYLQLADLPEPLRRLAAIRATRGCRDVYARLLEEYRKSHPDEYRIVALDAGDLRSSGDQAESIRRVHEVLSAHPDFAGGWLQLVFSEMDDDAMPGLMRLNQVRELSPNELWVEVLANSASAKGRQVSRDVVWMLFAVANHSAASGSVREYSLQPIIDNTELAPDLRERAMRTQLTFESETPQFMKATRLAIFLTEDAGRWKEARPMLETILAEREWVNARNTLALTYLFEAYDIDPAPTAKNATQIAKAKEILGGDFRNIQAMANPEALSKVTKMIADPELAKPEKRFAESQHAVCLATSRMDLDALKVALSRDGNPDADCDGTTPIGLLVRSLDSNWAVKREMVALLLELGADPNPKLAMGSYTAQSFCGDGFPACTAELMPLLKAAEASRPSRGATEPHQ